MSSGRAAATAVAVALLLGACGDDPEVPAAFLQPDDLGAADLAVEGVAPGAPFVSVTSCGSPDEHVDLRGGGGWVGYEVTTGDDVAGTVRSGAWDASADELEDLLAFLDRSPEDCPSSFPVRLDADDAAEVADAVGVEGSAVRVVRREREAGSDEQWRAYVVDGERLVVVDVAGVDLLAAVDPLPLVEPAVGRERGVDGDLAAVTG